MTEQKRNNSLASLRQQKPSIEGFMDAFEPLYAAGFRLEYLSVLPERNEVDPAAITILSLAHKRTKQKKYYSSVVFKRNGVWMFAEPIAYQGKINESF